MLSTKNRKEKQKNDVIDFVIAVVGGAVLSESLEDAGWGWACGGFCVEDA
jgi:hypothetical protein